MITVEALPAGFREMTHVGDEGNINYLIGGEGPPVVLLHGWPQTSRNWLQVAPAIAEAGYTVVAPDLPGLGASDPLPEGYAKDAQAKALRAVLRRLGFQDQIRVVGHDIGGYVAFSWARVYPEDVARLVVVDTTLPGLGLERAMDVANGGRWHHGFFMTPEVPEMLIAGSEDEFFGWWFGRLAKNQAAFPPAVVAATTATYRGRKALARSFGQYRALLDDGRVNAAWLDAGGRLTMPIAAIGGGLSLGESVARDLRAAARDLEMIVIDGAGHFVAEEQSDLFVKHVVRFLR